MAILKSSPYQTAQFTHSWSSSKRLARMAMFSLLLTGASQTWADDDHFKVYLKDGIEVEEDIYVYIKAGKEVGDDVIPCQVKVNLDSGLADCLLLDENKIDNLDPYSFNLKNLKPGYIEFPKVASGRMYFSIKYPLEFKVVENDSGNKTIPDPDGYLPTDPNYTTLYDKIEFSYTDGGIWMNPTAVDFFALPIRVEFVDPDKVRQNLGGDEHAFTVSGIYEGREKAMDKIRGYDSRLDESPWANLFLKDKNDALLRFMAPGKASVQNIEDTSPFPEDYLTSTRDDNKLSYVDTIWQYYNKNTVVIDVSELYDKYVDYKYIVGKSNKESFEFFPCYDMEIESSSYKGECKKLGDNTVAVIEKPTSSVPFYAGAVGPFDAANNTPKAIVVRQLTSAFEVGLLPAPNATILSKNYFIEKNKDFYQKNKSLDLDGGPWYDLYSAALHSFGRSQPLYSFAYDDALGQDGTLHDPYHSAVEITIGSLAGSEIPDPGPRALPKDLEPGHEIVIIPSNNTVLHDRMPIQPKPGHFSLVKYDGAIELKVNGETFKFKIQEMTKASGMVTGYQIDYFEGGPIIGLVVNGPTVKDNPATPLNYIQIIFPYNKDCEPVSDDGNIAECLIK